MVPPIVTFKSLIHMLKPGFLKLLTLGMNPHSETFSCTPGFGGFLHGFFLANFSGIICSMYLCFQEL